MGLSPVVLRTLGDDGHPVPETEPGDGGREPLGPPRRSLNEDDPPARQHETKHQARNATSRAEIEQGRLRLSQLGACSLKDEVGEGE